ncbi:hypothetical protein HAX54_051200, partial [Datura stramonium]|nr:hypothetical protein [Datura stramonium]
MERSLDPEGREKEEGVVAVVVLVVVFAGKNAGGCGRVEEFRRKLWRAEGRVRREVAMA